MQPAVTQQVGRPAPGVPCSSRHARAIDDLGRADRCQRGSVDRRDGPRACTSTRGASLRPHRKLGTRPSTDRQRPGTSESRHCVSAGRCHRASSTERQLRDSVARLRPAPGRRLPGARRAGRARCRRGDRDALLSPGDATACAAMHGSPRRRVRLAVRSLSPWARREARRGDRRGFEDTCRGALRAATRGRLSGSRALAATEPEACAQRQSVGSDACRRAAVCERTRRLSTQSAGSTRKSRREADPPDLCGSCAAAKSARKEGSSRG